MAVMRPYGGFSNGNPCGPCSRWRSPAMKRRFVFAGSPGRKFPTNGFVVARTYSIRVAGSVGALDQFDPDTGMLYVPSMTNPFVANLRRIARKKIRDKRVRHRGHIQHARVRIERGARPVRAADGSGE